MDGASATPPDRRERPERRTREPDRRALAAMASAASRARESDEEPGWTDGNEETGARRLVARSTTSGHPRSTARTPHVRTPGAPPPVRAAGRLPVVREAEHAAPPTAWGLDGRRPGNRRLRTLLVTVTIGVLVLAVTGLALVLALRAPSSPGPTHPTTGRAAHVTTGRTGTTPRSSGKPTHHASGGTAPSTTTPPSTAAAPPTAGPRLVSASPDSGGSGQSVVVDGSGLFSSTGEVVAYFDGTSAPTSCPSQTSCTVTVPDLGAHPSTVRLTIVTATGRSNPLTFYYRG